LLEGGYERRVREKRAGGKYLWSVAGASSQSVSGVEIPAAPDENSAEVKSLVLPLRAG